MRICYRLESAFCLVAHLYKVKMELLSDIREVFTLGQSILVSLGFLDCSLLCAAAISIKQLKCNFGDFESWLIDFGSVQHFSKLFWFVLFCTIDRIFGTLKGRRRVWNGRTV